MFETIELGETKIFALDNKDESSILQFQLFSDIHPGVMIEQEIDINLLDQNFRLETSGY